MTTMNISPPEEIRAFVEAQPSREGHASPSEIVRALIREDQTRRAKEDLEAKFREALESGPTTEMTSKDWAALRLEAMDGLGDEAVRAVSRVTRRPSANHDLIAIFRYLAREAGVRVADGFFERVEATFARLAEMPGLSAPYAPRDPLYAGLRFHSVTRFQAYFVFYRSIHEGIEVLRVLYGARDLQTILAEELHRDAEQGDAKGEHLGNRFK